jgi:hypothetical protein
MRWVEMEEAMEGARKMQHLANQYGITDIFADNGGKVLQIAVATGLDIVPGRMGADATDRLGNEYELKTIDLDKKASGYSTNHHLSLSTIARYAGRRFVFAEYRGVDLIAAYMLMPEAMKPVYTKWRLNLKGRVHLNNPKISIDFVRENGTVMYMKDVPAPWMPEATMRTSGSKSNRSARPKTVA